MVDSKTPKKSKSSAGTSSRKKAENDAVAVRNELKKTMAEMQKKHEAVVVELTQKRDAALADIRHRAADWENRASLASARVNELRTENRKLRDSVEPLKQQVRAHAKNVLESEKRVQELKRDLREALNGKTDAERRFAALENTAAQMQASRDNAKDRQNEAEKLLNKTESERQDALREVKDLKEKIVELDAILKNARIGVRDRG